MSLKVKMISNNRSTSILKCNKYFNLILKLFEMKVVSLALKPHLLISIEKTTYGQ